MGIRAATEADWPAIWPFWRDIVEAGETYAYPLGATSDQARGWWFDGSRVTVLEEDGSVLGSAKMGPNRPGRGAHVGTASFMVAASRTRSRRRPAPGRGHGRVAPRAGVRRHPVQRRRRDQHGAVRLWQDLGFTIVGTVPGAFESTRHGRVGLHVMYLDLG